MLPALRPPAADRRRPGPHLPLFSIDSWDRRTPLRAAAGDDELAAVTAGAVAHKELKHTIDEGPAFRHASRSMPPIGG